MKIISSKTLRNDYAAVALEAHESGEPLFVTRNGTADIVVMSQEAFEEREAMLDERAAVLEAEVRYRETGESYSLDELRSMLQAARRAGTAA